MDMAENVKERYELAKERILEVSEEDGVRGNTAYISEKRRPL